MHDDRLAECFALFCIVERIFVCSTCSFWQHPSICTRARSMANTKQLAVRTYLGNWFDCCLCTTYITLVSTSWCSLKRLLALIISSVLNVTECHETMSVKSYALLLQLNFSHLPSYTLLERASYRRACGACLTEVEDRCQRAQQRQGNLNIGCK